MISNINPTLLTDNILHVFLSVAVQSCLPLTLILYIRHWSEIGLVFHFGHFIYFVWLCCFDSVNIINVMHCILAVYFLIYMVLFLSVAFIFVISVFYCEISVCDYGRIAIFLEHLGIGCVQYYKLPSESLFDDKGVADAFIISFSCLFILCSIIVIQFYAHKTI